MRTRAIPLAAFLACAACLPACEQAGQSQPQPQPQPRDVSYADEVAPILETHCIRCHVPGQPGAEATGLLLDSHVGLMEGAHSGPVIKPGNARTSSLYILISASDNLTVNMPHGTDPLDAEEIETIRVWIENGAVDN